MKISCFRLITLALRYEPQPYLFVNGGDRLFNLQGYVWQNDDDTFHKKQLFDSHVVAGPDEAALLYIDRHLVHEVRGL